MTMSGRTGGVLPLLLLASFLSSFRPVLAIEFDMVFQTKCIFKEVMDDELVITGEFEAFKRDHPADKVKLNLRVESPLGEMVIEKRDVSSSDFKIDHPEAGDYKLCFTTKGEMIDCFPSVFFSLHRIRIQPKINYYFSVCRLSSST